VNECLTLRQFLWALQVAGAASFLLVTALVATAVFVGRRWWKRRAPRGVPGDASTLRRDGRVPGKLAPNRFHEAAWVVGDKHDIADDVWVGAFCVLDAMHDVLTIGEGSVIAAGAHVYTHSSVWRTRGEPASIDHAPTHIGARVSVCANATVLMGCCIGDGAVVAAGAVVVEGTRIGAGETWAGVPAGRVGMRVGTGSR